MPPRIMRAAARRPRHAADSRWRRDAGFAAAAAAVLAVYNNVVPGLAWHRRWYPAANACAAGAALAAAAASGLTAAELGLARDRVRPGLRLGSVFAAAAVAGWLVTALVPAARPVLRDQRINARDGRDVGYQALVRIPAGTVLWEETAFRGVLNAALHRILPAPAAIAVTSAVFGVWHIRPTIDGLRANQLASGPGQLAAAAAGGVVATAAAGVVLSLLRVRSGSLAAPVLVHLAANCPGVVAAWAVARRAPAGVVPGCRPRTGGAAPGSSR